VPNGEPSARTSTTSSSAGWNASARGPRRTSRATGPRCLCGDFNVAPPRWTCTTRSPGRDHVLFSGRRRAALARIVETASST
jgi:hypothetical protein